MFQMFPLIANLDWKFMLNASIALNYLLLYEIYRTRKERKEEEELSEKALCSCQDRIERLVQLNAVNDKLIDKQNETIHDLRCAHIKQSDSNQEIFESLQTLLKQYSDLVNYQQWIIKQQSNVIADIDLITAIQFCPVKHVIAPFIRMER
jgi:hypothetical protein